MKRQRTVSPTAKSKCSVDGHIRPLSVQNTHSPAPGLAVSSRRLEDVDRDEPLARPRIADLDDPGQLPAVAGDVGRRVVLGRPVPCPGPGSGRRQVEGPSRARRDAQRVAFHETRARAKTDDEQRVGERVAQRECEMSAGRQPDERPGNGWRGAFFAERLRFHPVVARGVRAPACHLGNQADVHGVAGDGAGGASEIVRCDEGGRRECRR